MKGDTDVKTYVLARIEESEGFSYETIRCFPSQEACRAPRTKRLEVGTMLVEMVGIKASEFEYSSITLYSPIWNCFVYIREFGFQTEYHVEPD